MSRRIQFNGSIAHKSIPRDLLKIELEKTKRARLIGEQTGLFYVPDVTGFNEQESTVDFEYLNGLQTVQEVAISNDAQLRNIFTRIGTALAAIHDNLVLPPEMKKNLPDEWMCSDEDNVFLHGDFTAHNICFHKASNRIVILDWSTADFLGGQHTYGSKYFDIAWLIYFIFHNLPAKKILGWKAKAMADAFIAGYIAQNPSGLKPDMLRRFHIYIEEFKRDKYWRGCRHNIWYKRMVFHGLWLWKYYRYHNYKPPLQNQTFTNGT